MSKQTLPTNFKDDIMSDAMNGKRRYRMIENEDGTISLVDATSYAQVGSTYGAAQVNAANTAINAAADAGKIVDDVNALKAVTTPGYIAGAKAVADLMGTIDSNLNSQLAEKDRIIAEKNQTIAELQKQVVNENNILNAFTIKKADIDGSDSDDGNFRNERYSATHDVEALYITVGRSVKNHDNSSRGIIIVTIRKNGSVLYEQRDHVNDFGGGSVKLSETIKVHKGDNIEVTRESYDLKSTYFNDACIIVGIAPPAQ